MKKTLCAVVAFLLLTSFCACWYNPDASEKTDTSRTDTTTLTSEESSTSQDDDTSFSDTTAEETTEETTEIYTGFPNDEEPDGTKRY